MNPRCRPLVFAILVCTAAAGLGTPAAAQESLFSLHFLGTSEETGDVRARGMGVLGVGLTETASAVALNPASHAALERMTISVIGLGGVRRSTAGQGTDREGLARFPHARFALPIPGDVVLSAGFMGGRNVHAGFRLDNRGVAGFGYHQEFKRDGSLYTMPLGVARRAGSHLRFGATVDFILGTIDEAWTTTGDLILAVRTRRRDTFSGQTATLGAQWTAWPWLRGGFTWTAGTHVDRSARTTIEDARIAGGTNALRDMTVLEEVELPGTVRGGVSVDAGSHWTFAADGLRRDWAAYDGRLYGAESVGLESRVAAGAEFRPGGRTFWGRLAYRAGVSRTTWPQSEGGNRLREGVLHLGAGLPLRRESGRLDFGFEYARVGDRDRNGAEESQWRLLLGLTGQETWKRRGPQ